MEASRKGYTAVVKLLLEACVIPHFLCSKSMQPPAFIMNFLPSPGSLKVLFEAYLSLCIRSPLICFYLNSCCS